MYVPKGEVEAYFGSASRHRALEIKQISVTGQSPYVRLSGCLMKPTFI